MSTPIPVNPPTSGFQPSGSTIGSGIGGAIAVVVIAALGAAHVSVSPELASAITVLCATLSGYLPTSGRK